MNGTDLKLLRLSPTSGSEAKSVFELVLYPDRSRGPAEDSGARPLEVNVLFTRVPATVKALERAAELARGLNARLRLLVAQVVPYGVPLETPPVLVEFQEALFRQIARGHGVETRVDILLCRDADSVFSRSLPSRSLVVLGAPHRWWRTREESLARKLRRLGHEVVMVYEKGNSHA